MATDTTGNYCPTHDKHYGKLEQCGECRRARNATVAPGSPKADMTQRRVHAADARLREAACWEQCKATMAADGHTAVKWSAESTKWARLAMELEQQITEVEHDQWLREQKRLLGGGGN